MWRFLIACGLVLMGVQACEAAPRETPVALTIDTSQADQALKILSEEAAGRTPSNEDWRELFATIPYQWLKARESSLGRALTDDDFKRFLASPEALAKRADWSQTLERMKVADMVAIGRSVLAWLPAGATIRAQVFPLIKPAANSFVWTEPKGGGPAIFLYVKPMSQAQFENTVAHETHHIGLNSLADQQQTRLVDQPERVRRAVEWMGAFGEGEAMLAAAGSVERHPHWEDDAASRARWDGDLMHFNTDVAQIAQLLSDILDGRLNTDEQIRQRAAPFWGEAQGAWYTVGYEMAALVERRFGRAALNEALLDPRELLVRYNQVAAEADAKGATLATWPAQLLARLGVGATN